MKFFLFLVSLAVAPVVFGETSTERVKWYFSDIKSGNYLQAAGHVDAEQLREFRSMMEFYKEMPLDAQNEFVSVFFGEDSTVESVAESTDAQFFAALLGFIMRKAKAAGGMDLDGIEVLGAVKEGNDVEHLVTRNRVRAGEIELEAMEVVSLRRKGDRWYILMSGKIKGLPQQLKAAFGNDR